MVHVWYEFGIPWDNMGVNGKRERDPLPPVKNL